MQSKGKMPTEQDFFNKIKTTGILDAAKNLGIDKNEFINSRTAESYADHEWMVIDNSEVGIVINAVPDIAKTASPSSINSTVDVVTDSANPCPSV